MSSDDESFATPPSSPEPDGGPAVPRPPPRRDSPALAPPAPDVPGLADVLRGLDALSLPKAVPGESAGSTGARGGRRDAGTANTEGGPGTVRTLQGPAGKTLEDLIFPPTPDGLPVGPEETQGGRGSAEPSPVRGVPPRCLGSPSASFDDFSRLEEDLDGWDVGYGRGESPSPEPERQEDSEIADTVPTPAAAPPPEQGKSLEDLLFPPTPEADRGRPRAGTTPSPASRPRAVSADELQTPRSAVRSPGGAYVLDTDSEDDVRPSGSTAGTMATREEVDLMDSDSDDGQRALPAPSRVGQPPVDSDSDDELPVLAPPKPKPDLDRWRKNNATPPKNSTVLIDLTNSPGDLPGFLPPPGKTSGPPSDRSPGSTPPRPVSAPVVFAKPKLVLPVNDSYSTFDASFRAPSKPLPAEQTPDSPPPPDSAGPDGVHPALALLTSDPDPSLLADVDQPRDLTVRLMPHQLVGLRFLVGQERASARRGGILADDMGLGKTVQTIALILANRPRPDPALAFGQPKDRKATLVVATKALAPQWAREVKSKTRPGALSVLVYHGPVRPRDPRVLERYDVVITTYSTLEAERRSHAGSDAEAERELGTLFRARWLRVVLDEAHLIKNRAAKSSVAACHLDASYRLCLTGTPCQNSLEDVHSLLKFLRIPPYDDHKLFKSEVLEPYKRAKGNQAVLALERLRAVLATVMLRRTKASVDGAGKPLLELPPKDVDLVRCELGERERAFYDSLEGRMRAEFEGMAAAEQRKYTTVLTLILRLRQCCDHPALVGAVEEEEAEVDRELRGASAGSEVDGLSERLASFSVSSSAAAGKGPVSREKKNAAVLARLLRSWTPSAKTDAAMDLLRRELEEDAGNKVCVFSQFTSFLDVFEIPLREAGYRFVRYDGTMSIAQREEVLASFRNNKNVRIMLISLKCGSLGLNLVCANKVIVLDPWWNGTIEDQAVDRVHRIGQTKPVRVSKLIVDGTIEDRIVQLQEKKRELIKGVIGEGGVAGGDRLTWEQLRFLFQPSRRAE